MKNILLVISKFHPEYTGASHRLGAMYKRMNTKENPLCVEVICNSTRFADDAKYEYDGLKVKRIGFPSVAQFLPTRLYNALKIYYEFFRAMCLFIRAKPDLVHIVGYSGATIAAILFFMLKRTPRLIELVTKEATPSQFLPGFRYSKLLGLQNQTIIVAISEHLRKTCFNIGLRENIWCRPNSVDISRFSYRANKRLTQKRMSGSANLEVTIGMLAKFMPQKNQIFLLEVLASLPRNFRLLLAGPLIKDGIHKDRDIEYFNEIKTKINDLGLQSRVCLIPEFMDGPKFLEQCDVFALPQFNEGLGTPMLESLSFGIPVVANAAEPAFREWVVDGRNGFLRDLVAEQWVEAIQAVLKFSKKQKIASAEKIIKIVKAERIDKQYQRVFDSLSTVKFDSEVNVAKILERPNDEQE